MSRMGLDWNRVQYARTVVNMCTGGQKQKQMCVYNAYISYLCPPGEPRRNDTPKQREQPVPRSWILNTILQEKEQVSLKN